MNSVVVRQEDEFDGYDEQGQLEPHGDQSSRRFAHPSVPPNHDVRGVSEAINSPAQFWIAIQSLRHGRGADSLASGAFGLAQPCGQHDRQVGIVQAARPSGVCQRQAQGQPSTVGNPSNSNEGEIARRLARRLARRQREGLPEQSQSHAEASRCVPHDHRNVGLNTLAHQSEPTPSRPINFTAYVQPYVKVMSYDGLRADAAFPYPGRPRTPEVSP